MKKFFLIQAWRLIKILPSSLRGKLSRKLYRVKDSKLTGKLSEVIFKAADSLEEIEAALELVQRNYKRLDMTFSDELIRATKYNTLPTTTIFIAKYRGEVIATISQITDSGLGLPIDDYQDISSLRNEGGRICELSALTVKEEWRSHSTGIFFPLSMFALKYCLETLSAQYIVISIRNSVKNFYEDILLFKPLGKAQRYEGVNNLKSISMVLRASGYNEAMESVYKGQPLSKNVYRLMTEYPWMNQCEISQTRYGLVTSLLLNETEVRYLFDKQSDVVREMIDKEKSIMKNYYLDGFSLDELSSEYDEYLKKRESTRFHVNMPIVITCGDELIKGSVLEVSRQGLSIFTSKNLRVQDSYHVKITLEQGRSVKLKVQNKWTRGRQAGFQILSSDNSDWSTMITYFENFLSRDAKTFAKKKKLAA